jgi:hypothetical protein
MNVMFSHAELVSESIVTLDPEMNSGWPGRGWIKFLLVMSSPKSVIGDPSPPETRGDRGMDSR